MNSSSNTNASPIEEPKFLFGPYVPIFKSGENTVIDSNGIVKEFSEHNPEALKDRELYEVLPDDAIADTPSLTTRFLLKKKTVWPSKASFISPENKVHEEAPKNQETTVNNDDEVQVLHVVEKNNNTKPVESYIKTATIAHYTGKNSEQLSPVLTVEDYFKTTAADLLIGIGLSRVLEFNIEDKIRKLARKAKTSRSLEIDSLIDNEKAKLVEVAQSNKPYKPTNLLTCPCCQFKSEFNSVIEYHLEVPHYHRRNYLCNWCFYKTKDSYQIIVHVNFEHKKRCRIEKPLLKHTCEFCSFECKSKRTFVSHTLACEKTFPHNSFLKPTSIEDITLPGITSKFITKKDLICYESTLRSLQLNAYNPHQLKISGSDGSKKTSVLIVPGRKAPNQNNLGIEGPLATQQSFVSGSCSVIAPDIDLLRACLPSQDPPSTHSNLMDLLISNDVNLNLPRATLSQHPRPSSSFVNGSVVLHSASSFIMSSQGGDNAEQRDLIELDGPPPAKKTKKKQAFVYCEICDAYVEDINQLRVHMHRLHDVQVRHKSLRPPLACPKCQLRFLTDQGLERHLLGKHALITANVQEQIDRATDSGKCTHCGRFFAEKLVAHMKDSHKLNIKRSNLSYGCTVCRATFGLYKLFEIHVNNVHTKKTKNTIAIEKTSAKQTDTKTT